jgi:hypothetical protein
MISHFDFFIAKPETGQDLNCERPRERVLQECSKPFLPKGDKL